VNIPTVQQAERYLAEAEAMNPGPWAQHSRVVAEAARAIAARAIAAHHPDLDPTVAYVLGLLHDVGRRFQRPGVPDVRHVLDGHAFLRDLGFDDAARICLTHSFPIKHVDAFAGPWDCPARERHFVQNFLDGVEYAPYDRLVQLCDALALPAGPCLIEKRLVDVALRHGFNALTLDKWRAYLALQRDFDRILGQSLYRLLPTVVDTTFGF
jgi:hypothetical protein